MITYWLGAHVLFEYTEVIEHYSGGVLVVFGAAYAARAYFTHSHCHGHTHHGPEPTRKSINSAYLFLFSLGLSPCVAVLPVFITAAPLGVGVLALAMAAFSVGVLTALIGASTLVSYGVMKLDHPILEHYGEVITGVGVALLGVLSFFVHVN